MDLDDAVESHIAWKARFKRAIATGENLDTHSISQDNCCALGTWLHSEAKEKYGHCITHKDCILKHKEFHFQAGKIAELINSGQVQTAENELEGRSAFNAASSAIGIAIMKLKKEVLGFL